MFYSIIRSQRRGYATYITTSNTQALLQPTHTSLPPTNQLLTPHLYPTCWGNNVIKKLKGSKIAPQRYKIKYKNGIFFSIKNTKISFKYIISSKEQPTRRICVHIAKLSAGATSQHATSGKSATTLRTKFITERLANSLIVVDIVSHSTILWRAYCHAMTTTTNSSAMSGA